MSKPTSVEELVEMIWASALDVSTSKDFDTEDKYLKARKNSLAHYSSKINRLIVQGQIKTVQKYLDINKRNGYVSRGLLENDLAALTKELGDSNE